MTTLTLTLRMAEFICSAGDDSLSAAAREQATRAILDTLAVTVAGGVEQPVSLLDHALDPSTAAGSGVSPWSGKRLGTGDSALLYGMASHVLDYDDGSTLGVCHPSAPILAALLAATPLAAIVQPPSGRAFRLAFCVGTEVMGRVGQAMGFRPYELGFHTTAILGTIGAAAAASKLLGLDRVRTAHALAIAASMAAGLCKNFGSMVKALHVGLAASNGLRAARLAAAGVEGCAEPFEADAFLKAFSGGATDSWPNGVAFGQPYAVETPGFGQKLFPCCYMLHKMIVATLALRVESGCTLAQVQGALVLMPKGASCPLIHPRPRTGLHGKFSAPYAIVASLLDGRIDLKSFTDSSVMRPEVQARLTDVTVVESDTAPVHGTDMDGPVTVTLTMRDGSVLTRTVEHAPGSAADPLPLDQLQVKWIDCLQHGRPSLPAAQAAGLFDEGCRLETMPGISTWLSAVLTH